MRLLCRDKILDLTHPRLMAILNLSPDSFSDGAEALTFSSALKKARRLIAEGADIIDLGAQASGPNSINVSVDEECSRIAPLIKVLSQEFAGIISVDTSRAEVAKTSLECGANFINDILAGRGDDPAMFSLISSTGAGYCLMYSKDATPRTTAENRQYADVCKTIVDFWSARLQVAFACGVKREQICLDPGLGFFLSAKAEYSLEVIRNLPLFTALGFPLLLGSSRKSFIGEVCQIPIPDERLAGGLVVEAFAVWRGVKIIRTHDVLAGKRALLMAEKLYST